MENVTSFLRTAAYAAIFCIAGFSLLYQFRALNIVITINKENISSKNILYEQNVEVLNEEKVTYPEIITSLFTNLECDIQVNDIVISKDNFNYQDFDFLTIPKGDYVKSYVYDSSGNIARVIYTLYPG